MTRFRKLPVEIEAVQFTGDYSDELDQLVGRECFALVDESDRGDDPEVIAEVYDKLHSTWVGVKKGQWVIRGVAGEFYPCADSVFRETYEEVTR